jgi:hypothetical protein
MKNIVAIIAVALSVSAPAFAESAAELFAASNDSAAETLVRATSVGDIPAAQIKFALNDSPAEMNLNFDSDGDVTRSNAAQAFFALSNDSAAERRVN